MKRILIILLMAISAQAVQAQGIVNNSGTNDSLSLSFVMLDSSSNYTTLAADDSLILVVSYPNGDSAFGVELLGNSGLITATTNSMGHKTYFWSVAIPDIDGGTPVNGVYSWVVNAWDKSLSLPNPSRGYFQLYQTMDLADWMDSLVKVTDSVNLLMLQLDTTRYYAGWMVGAKAYSTYTADKDSIEVKAPDGTTIAWFYYYHPGGTAGDKPDTVKTAGP